MTLPVILLFSLSCASAMPLLAATPYQNAQQETPASKSTAVENTQDQGTAPPAQNPSKPTPSATQKATGQNQPAAKKPRRRKKTLPANCDSTSASAAGSAAAGSTSTRSAPPDTGTGGIASPAGVASAGTNCPPQKIVVRQGGTSDPNIQLAGGPVGEKALQQRDAVNQMLAETEQNLKKITAHELTGSQQDAVSQTRQFIEQARAAVAAEDFDRARTLAWKAQLLSEELANPQK